MWKETLERTNMGRWIDRGLASYLSVLVLVNFFNAYQTFDIASWEEFRALMGLSFVIAIIVPLLWKGTFVGLEMTRFFYLLQIPATMAIYTFYYAFDGGLAVSLGYLNSALRFNFFLFRTNLSMGFLNAETDGTAFGLTINLIAVALVIYYSLRLRCIYRKGDN